MGRAGRNARKGDENEGGGGEQGCKEVEGEGKDKEAMTLEEREVTAEEEAAEADCSFLWNNYFLLDSVKRLEEVTLYVESPYRVRVRVRSNGGVAVQPSRETRISEEHWCAYCMLRTAH